MSYQAEKFKRIAMEAIMKALEDVEPEFIETEEPKVVKINNEKIPKYDSDSPVDHERIVTGILEMFKLSVQHNCEPEMEFGFQINDRILKAKVELEVE